MYSAVLMLAMTTGMDAADFGRRGGGCSGGGGCYGGGGYGCCGGGGYGGGYYGGGYRTNYGGGYAPTYGYMPSQYYGSNNYYGSNTYLQNQTPEIRQSFYMAPNQNFASIRVLVPNSDAEIWFDGAPTQQRGMERFFHSPPLDTSSNYRYTVKARWTENGQTVNRERQVDVRPGQPVFVDFRAKEGGEQLPGPRGNTNTNPNLNNPRINPEIPNTNPKVNPNPPNPKGTTPDTK